MTCTEVNFRYASEVETSKELNESKTYLDIAVLVIRKAKLDDKNKECFKNIFSFVSDDIKD